MDSTYRAFRNIAILLMLGFLLVGAGAGYWSFARANELNTRADNPRVIARERRVLRGSMLANDGETALVETELDEDGIALRQYHYPQLAPITGVWSLRYANTGLEAAYNDWLSGRRGEPMIQLLDGLLHRPVDGYDLVLTIDRDLQASADALLGDRAGAVIVMNPKTGDVLALASHPTFDPNTFEDTVEELQQSPADPLLNRATQGLYTPGSVFKLVTLAGALGKGETSLRETWEDPGIYIVNGFPVRDYETPPEERFDTAHALAYSSNVVFAQLGLRLGADAMREVAQNFGFGETPPIAIDASPSSLGTDAFLLDDVGLANTAYGQGQVQVTPLHMALITSAVANGGVLPEAKLVQEIRTPEGKTIRTIPSDGWKRAMSSRLAAQVKEAMIVSARDGYARSGAPAGIAIGGKTGTAQLGGTLTPHAWFTAFAPADDPEIVVTVVVENGGLGGAVAAPIARQLIEQAIRSQ